MDARAAALGVGLACVVALQVAGWAVAVAFKTEKFFDALGSAGFLFLALWSLAYSGVGAARQIVMTALVCVWALRLGTFLLFRAVKAGGDSRFDELKTKPLRFLAVWLIQAAWNWIVTLPLLLLNSAGEGPPFGAWTDGVGIALWALGFLLETTADFQKYAFKSDAANKGRFIDAGLWRLARYPNYCGEIMLQVGVFVGCCAVFSGADWASVVAPLFTALLLLGVSGVPLQERQAAERWGGDAAYQEYKRRTWLLLPLPRPAFLRRRAA